MSVFDTNSRMGIIENIEKMIGEKNHTDFRVVIYIFYTIINSWRSLVCTLKISPKIQLDYIILKEFLDVALDNFLVNAKTAEWIETAFSLSKVQSSTCNLKDYALLPSHEWCRWNSLIIHTNLSYICYGYC